MNCPRREKKRQQENMLSTWHSELESFRRQLKLDEKSDATIQKYLHDVQAFLEWQEGAGYIRKEQAIAYKDWLSKHYSIRSANSMLTALNQFLKHIGAKNCCVKLFRFQFQTLCDQERGLTREESHKLLEPANPKRNQRTYFLLMTLCATGIRVGELKFITVEAVQSGTAMVRNKGKSRKVLIPRKLCRLLEIYAHCNGQKSGPIFITKNGKPLDRSNIWRSLQKLCQEAGIDLKKGFPHNLRHLFACTFYEKERDISHLADILGHKSINTTRIYTLTNGEIYRSQIESLNLFIPETEKVELEKEKQLLCCKNESKDLTNFLKSRNDGRIQTLFRN